MDLNESQLQGKGRAGRAQASWLEEGGCDGVWSVLVISKNTKAHVTPGEDGTDTSSSSQGLDGALLSGRADPAIEENGLGFVVSDEKEKWVIDIKCHPGRCGHYGADSPTGSGGLGAIFIHLHEGFVDNF